MTLQLLSQQFPSASVRSMQHPLLSSPSQRVFVEADKNQALAITLGSPTCPHQPGVKGNHSTAMGKAGSATPWIRSGKG